MPLYLTNCLTKIKKFVVGVLEDEQELKKKPISKLMQMSFILIGFGMF